MRFEEVIALLNGEMAAVASTLLSRVPLGDTDQIAEKLVEYRTIKRMVDRLTAEDQRLDKE